MKQKLLHKTLRIYLFFSIIILLVSAPIFYFVVDKLFLNDVDETLLLRKKEFEHYSLPNLKEKDIPIINKSNKNVKIYKNKQNLKKNQLLNEIQYDSLTKNKVNKRTLQAPVKIEGKPYLYKIQINISTRDLIKNIAFVYITILILLIAGLFLITRYFSLRVWRPFYQTLSTIEHFDIEEPNLPENLPETTIEEFERLNQSLMKLIKRTVSTYNNQKEFIGNASHELQTPIAVLQAQIETLIQHEELTKEKTEILSNIKETISKLNRLNKNLLLLSKIEYLSTINLEKFNLIDIITRLVDIYKIQATENKITIHIEQDTHQISLYSNLFLTETLFSNLISNSIKHNYNGGNVTIRMNNEFIEISNTSQTDTLPTEKIFERFTKLNPSSKGSGIGLAIVKKIISVLHYKLEYHYEKNSHFFTLYLPNIQN